MQKKYLKHSKIRRNVWKWISQEKFAEDSWKLSKCSSQGHSVFQNKQIRFQNGFQFAQVANIWSPLTSLLMNFKWFFEVSKFKKLSKLEKALEINIFQAFIAVNISAFRQFKNSIASKL